jgi:hypothetical protein
MKTLTSKLTILVAILLAGAFLFSCAPQQKEEQQEATDEQQTETVEEKSEDVPPNTLTAKEEQEGWQLLFDGETTEGWRGYNKDSLPSRWEVVDGTLHLPGSGRGEAGAKDGGDIIYDEKFQNFEFSIEWKVNEGGNSGIFYLAQEIEGKPIWHSAPEMQVLDNEKHPDGRDINRSAGALYDMLPTDTIVCNPAGEWNEAKILVYKGTVEHWLNGKKLFEYHLWTDKWKEMVAESKFSNLVDYRDWADVAEKGYIGLQDHGDDVWFRNIKIKEM